MNTNLQVGRIPFLVCAPFFHRFIGQIQPNIHFVDGVPKALNTLLRLGKVHLAPSSTLEYAQASEKYFIAPKICTSSTLEIRSVKLFSLFPWEKLDQKRVHLTGQSDTSVALTRVLSALHFGVSPHFEDTESFSREKFAARVLIGDQALREDAFEEWPYRYDLATVWQEWQGLPFVFGMWIVHESALDPVLRPVLDDFLSEMGESVDAFRQHREVALQAWCALYPSGLPWDLALQYYDAVDYHFTADRQESLLRFYGFCHQLGLIPRAPALRFLPEL